MAVIATGNRKPDRRAARLLPGLRLRCCDKAVLPSAMHPGAGAPKVRTAAGEGSVSRDGLRGAPRPGAGKCPDPRAVRPRPSAIPCQKDRWDSC